MRLTHCLVLALSLVAACHPAEPSPSRIAFISERDGNREIRVVDLQGIEFRLTTSPADDYPAAASTDGRRLAIITAEQIPTGSAEQLRVAAMPSGIAHPIGPRAAIVRHPGWSPDDGWLAFESSAGSFRDIYRIESDGTRLRRLTDNREGNFDPHISPDGRHIVFVSSRDGNSELYRMNADGSAVVRLTAYRRDDWEPSWSPDGKRIAFLSDRDGEDRIYIINADGTGIRRATSDSVRSGGLESSPAWSPDSRRIAYVMQRRDAPARLRIVDLASHAANAIVARDAGAPTGDMNGAGAQEGPAFSPDGQWLAFSWNDRGNVEIHVARADGTDAHALTHAPGADWLPRWVR
ncbi:MAG: PD40 domain-containing protein [Gemmatimonadaceae bacterium]|nr:PD40 domain-containing protein [Gemmatimonadaceae bacterium]